MSNLLNIKDQNGNWIPIPVVTNGIKSITQNEDYTLTITLNDGTTYTTTSIKGEDGQDYILTEQDKQDIAGLVDTPVDDVRINGQSIVESGVANIPYGSNDNYGLLKASSTNGIFASGGVLSINNASESDIKGGTEELKPLTPNREHMATFYGLAKASGDSTQSQSDNEVGVYTDEAKASIKNMLGVEDVDIDSKAPVITETATGSIVSFDDGADDIPLKSCIVQVNPVQDLHGYDHPWPAGGGKNLFQTTAVTTTVDGVTFTVNSDGSIKTTGTPTRAISTFVFGRQTLPSGEYIANGFANGANSETRMVFFNENTGAVVAIIYKGNGVTFTLTEESVVRVYPIILTDSYESGWTFYPMIRKATEADATFTPYSNECPITGWTGCEVQRTEKNLWDEEWEIGSYASSTGDVWNTTDRIRSKADNYISIVPNTLYYSKCSSIIDICYYDADKTHLSSTAVSANSTFTTPSNARYMRFGLRPVYGTTYNHDISINYPSTDHDYHPYTGQTYPITFPSEAGIVYGGYVDVINGELVVDRASVVLSSSNSYGYNGRRNSNLLLALSVSGKKPGEYNFNSDRFSLLPSASDKYTMHGRAATTTIEFEIPFSALGLSGTEPNATMLAAGKTWMEENHPQLVYELAEPIHYPLTPTEIKTLLGQNNIWADTGDAEVEYRASTKMYIDKKITEAVAAALNS